MKQFLKHYYNHSTIRSGLEWSRKFRWAFPLKLGASGVKLITTMELIFSALLSVFLEEIADSEEEYSHFLLLNNSSSALTDPLHFFLLVYNQ